MEKGIMFGLIGIGVAILIAVIFIVMVLAGPKLSEKRAERQATEEANAVLEAVQALNSKIDSQGSGVQKRDVDSIIAKLNSLQSDVSAIKGDVGPASCPEPEEVECAEGTGSGKWNPDDPINSLTKDNCDDAEDEVLRLRNEAEDEMEAISDTLNATREEIDVLQDDRDQESNTTVKGIYNDHIDTLRDWETELETELEEWEDEFSDYENMLEDVKDECNDLK